MAETRPSELHHGTPHAIDGSSRPFLDPRLARRLDPSDPTEGHVFASSSRLLAASFAIETVGVSRCVLFGKGNQSAVAVFKGTPPTDAKGNIYHLNPDGFRPVLQRGKPTANWVMLEQDMPRVRDIDGSEVPGIPVAEVTRVSISLLVGRIGLRICVLSPDIPTNPYFDAMLGIAQEEGFDRAVQHGISHSWMEDVTNNY